MRLLMLTPELPDRDGTGGARRCWELVVGLTTRGHQVTVGSVAYRDQQPAIEAMHRQHVETVLAVRPEPQWREALAGSARSPRTLGVLARESFHRWQSAIFASELAAPLTTWLSTHQVDVALIEHDWAMAEFGRLLPADIPTIGGFHNITSRMHARAAESNTGVRRRFEAREARRQAADLERLPRSMVAATACSASEADEIVRRTGLPCAVVPNGADTAALAAIPAGGGTPGALLFSGSLGYPPNADAARWLATEVLPRVRRRHPEARLTIVGRDAPASLTALASDAVHLPGFVPDLEPVLADAAVYVAGLLSGAGTKLKVVEALGAGRPLVATTVAAEGLELTSGTQALIADGADAFAEAVTALLDDPALAARLAEAGRAHVATAFSWDAAVAALDAQLNAVAAGP